MVLKAETKEFKRELISADQHIAVVVGIWSIGKQRTSFEGVDKIITQCILLFEVDELYEEGEVKGKHMTIAKWYTQSLSSKANLKKSVESFIGKELLEDEIKDFDLESIIGKTCLLDIIHKNDKVKINQVSKLPKALTPFKPDNLYINQTPDWVKKIQESAVNEEEEKADKVEKGLCLD